MVDESQWEERNRNKMYYKMIVFHISGVDKKYEWSSIKISIFYLRLLHNKQFAGSCPWFLNFNLKVLEISQVITIIVIVGL